MSKPAGKVSISEAAKALGVSVQALRDHCHGKHGPALAFTRYGAGRAMFVNVEAARKHLDKHGGKRLLLTDPPAMTSAQPTPSDQPFTGDPHTVLRDAMNMISSGANLKPQHVQAIAAAARELRQKSLDTVKASSLFETDEVVGYLRSVGEAWVESTNAAMDPLSSKLVAYIKTQFGVDLTIQNIGAPGILKAFLQTELRAVIAAVNDQVKAVERKVGDKAA